MTSGNRGSEAVGSGQPYRGPHQAAPARGSAVQGNITMGAISLAAALSIGSGRPFRHKCKVFKITFSKFSF